MDYSIAQDCFCTQADATASGVGTMGGGGSLCSNTSNCTNRWQSLVPAVTDTLTNAQNVNWGLKFFPTPTASADCTVSTTLDASVGSDKATIMNAIQSAKLRLSTPTAAALKAATAQLQALTDSNPRFILLATDGEPNCAGNPPSINRPDVPGASAAAQAAKDAGFPVYVIGIGPNPGDLTTVAQAGGTNDYYKVSSPQELVDAFSTISQLVATCSFTLDSTPPDPNNIAVYLDKNLVQQDSTNGWSLSGNNTVVLNGDTCSKVMSGQATTVQVLFGCQGPPPSTIL